MKKIAYFVVGILLIGLLLVACNPTSTNLTEGDVTTVPTVTTSPTVTTAPTETTAPTQTAAPTETTTPTQTTAPTSPSVDPQIAAELEAFEELFRWGGERNPYAYALGFEYASPEELRLYYFYDGGFEGEHEITDEEWEELKKQSLGPDDADGPYTDFNRLPVAKINDELQALFGISVADLADSAFSGVFYLECSDSYCFQSGGMTSNPKMGSFLDLKHNDDGTVSLTYECMGDDKFVITLKPNGDDYLILSNVKVK